MSLSFRLMRVAGIDIRVHASFFLILLLGAFQWREFGPTGALFGMLLMILLFACVVLHELGHSLVAQYFGIPVRDIVLLPLGGVAQLERAPDKPMHELLIAAAGPLVNVAIAALLLLGTGASASLGLFDTAALLNLSGAPSVTTAVVWLLYANISLVIFNLIPAFPLDGGRIFRAGLALMIGMPRATRIAVVVGRALAVLLGAFAIATGNLLLVLIAVFIFSGAGQEQTARQVRTVLATLRVGDAYNKHALTLAVGDRVSKVVDYILTSYQPDFAVMQGSRLLGIVTRDDVFRTLNTESGDVYVTGIMRREVMRAEPHETLEDVSSRMAQAQQRIVAVYEGETYLGLVSIEDIGEALALATYIERQKARTVPVA